MKKIFITGLSLLFISTTSFEQGCVIVRNISGFGQYNPTDNGFSTVTVLRQGGFANYLIFVGASFKF